MEVSVQVLNKTLKADLNKPIDLSIEVKKGEGSSIAFHAPNVNIEPIRSGSFVGDVSEGGPVNTNIVSFNPHGNSTHTESLAHISDEDVPVNKIFKKFMWLAYLHTVSLEFLDTDSVISLSEFKKSDFEFSEALIIRTNPVNYNFSGNNPAYLSSDAAEYLRLNNVKHLLIDLPSVDKEEDGGLLSSHKAFWGVPDKLRRDASITELIKIPENIKDGWYLLELQIMNLRNNSSPSRPIIYELL